MRVATATAPGPAPERPAGAGGGRSGHRLDFVLPPELEAGEPPEARGLARDQVRLLVARRGDATVSHTTFARLPSWLGPADLVVVNTSSTLPAAVAARAASGEAVQVHLGTHLASGAWLVELRRPLPPASLPFAAGRAGLELRLPGGAHAALLAPYPVDSGPGPARLWLASIHLPQPVAPYLAEHGQPIRYRYSARAWPLATYQNVYARQPGSAEMCSAGRPFTHELITELVARGVGICPIVLHTGLSSPEAHERPCPEPFVVPAETAERVNRVRRRGGRVIAVGTTVVRALETSADDRGRAHPARGWTELVVTPERGVKVVDGVVTGWHEPQASHLDLLEAVAGTALLEASYREALAHGYRWHELGDSHLILP